MAMSSSERLTKQRQALTILAGVALITLGACASDGDGKADKRPPITPSERFAIEVQPDPQELKLAAHGGGLSQAQVDALGDFVARWNDTERGPITIKAPEHGPDHASVYRTATETRDRLVSAGVPAVDVRIVGYDAGGDDHAPVRVGFLRYEARGPQCGQSWSDLAKPDTNGYPEFGCAVTANIAAQVAYPADLLRPEGATPPDGPRRESVLNAYRRPSTTSTPKDPQAQAIISSVGN